MRQEAHTCTMHTIIGGAGKAGTQPGRMGSQYTCAQDKETERSRCAHGAIRGKACAWVKSCRHSGKGFENHVH